MPNIPIVILLPISMAASLGYGVITRCYARRDGLCSADIHLFNTVTALLSGVVLLLWGGFGQASAFTLAMGAAFGLIVGLLMLFTLRAVSLGSWSYSTVLISLSTLITALSGVAFWGESLSAVQVVGIACMVGCLVLSVAQDKAPAAQKPTLRWLLMCLLAFLCSGAVGLLQKIHQTSVHRGELSAFLIVAFGVLFLYSAVMWLIARKSRARDGAAATSARLSPVWLLLLALGGALQAVNHKLNLYLSGVMDTAVFFPIVNGGGLVLTAALAMIVFRERLTRRQWIGMLLGILSVILVCDPF